MVFSKRFKVKSAELAAIDLFLLLVAAFLAYIIRAQLPFSQHVLYPLATYIPFGILLIAAWLLFMYVFGLYGGHLEQPANFLGSLVKLNYNFVLFVAVVAFVLRITTTNRTVFLLFITLGDLAVFLTHGLTLLRRSKLFTVIGADDFASSAFDAAKGYFTLRDAEFLGFLPPSAEYNKFFDDKNLPMMGTMEHSLPVLSEKVDCVVVALPPDFPAREHLLEDLHESGIRVLLAYKIPESIDFVLI